MKNRVARIALPGAILAFAMVLFGGSAYAYTSWQGGREHLETASDNIDILVDRIKELKGKQSDSEGQLKTLSDQNDVLKAQLTTLSDQNDVLKGQLQNLEATSSNEVAGKQGEIDTKQRQIDDMQRRIDEKQRQIEARQRAIDGFKTEVISLKKKLADEERHVDELTKALGDARNLKEKSEKAVEETK